MLPIATRTTYAAGSVDALFPLIGVLLGGLLAGGMAFLLERARDRRSARAAALLVSDEMKGIWTTLDISVGNFRGEFVGKAGDEWDTSQWDAHRAALAAGLAPEVWGSIANSYRLLRSLPKGAQAGGLLAAPREEPKTGRGGRRKPTRPHPLRSVVARRDSIGKALNQLETDAGLPVTELKPSPPGP